jgi:hypothetical protein
VRQAGELLAQMKMRGERSGGGKSGANKQQSSRYSNSSSNAASRTRT